MRVLIINVLYCPAIEGNQPVVNVCGGRMDRLFPQARQARRGAANHGRNKDCLPLTDTACRTFGNRRLVVTQPANEITYHRMQLCGAALVGFDNTLKLLRQVKTVAGDHQNLGNLL